MKEYKDIQITLTKEFHTNYWDTKMKMLNYSLIALGAAFILLIVGIWFDALPKTTLSGAVVSLFIYISVVMSAVMAGVHIGISTIGKRISERIHEEHPELYEKSEKKDE